MLSVVPPGAARGLDAGCGEGLLAARLRELIPAVTGIDRDAASIEAARRVHGRDGLEFRLGDILTAGLEPGSYDFVSCVAALHHMDAETGLRTLAGLLRPGGRLAVIGLATECSPADWDPRAARAGCPAGGAVQAATSVALLPGLD